LTGAGTTTGGVSVLAMDAIVHTATRAGRAASKIIAAKVGADVLASKSNARDLLTAVDAECERVIAACVAADHPTHAFLGEESVPAGAKASAEALDAAMAASSAEFLWIVDPIDGTTNFVQSLPLVGVSIGVAHRAADGEWALVAGVVCDPFKDEVFAATAGGGATLDGAPIRVGDEVLAEAVVATGFAPNDASLRPMVRGIAAVGSRARTVRMLGSAAIMLAWVACGRLSAYFEADLNAWDTAAGVLLVREAGGVVTDLRGEPFRISTRPLLASNAAAHAALRDTLADANVTGLDD
jgi:myo-inositol-1(or 4)-monophosphatase